MKKSIRDRLSGKKIVILGYGREGQSTYRYLRRQFPEKAIAIADRDSRLPVVYSNHKKVTWLTGPSYQQQLADYDLIIKSPGIKLPGNLTTPLTSQSELFLAAFGERIIGVTGTKGKSTTTALIHHIISCERKNVVIVGNMGIPPFEEIEAISPETIIAQEISAHQLESSSVAPATAVFLNLYEEHLDRFGTKSNYYQNKLRILENQQKSDHAVMNDEELMKGDLDTYKAYPARKWLFGFEKTSGRKAWLEGDNMILDIEGTREQYPLKAIHLRGRHNLLNVMAAGLACRINDISQEAVAKGITTFPGLEHRLEYVGTVDGIAFFNDSISTIPQTTIEALKTLPETETLILGGFDRKIDYQPLYSYLEQSEVKTLLLTGPAGERIQKEYPNRSGKKVITFGGMKELVDAAFRYTKPGKICLLSPAASSYDRYKDFTERGKLFKAHVHGK